MSAQAINIARTVLSGSIREDNRAVEMAKDNCSVMSKLPFKALYQFHFAPELTAEQIAMEEFLLECD